MDSNLHNPFRSPTVFKTVAATQYSFGLPLHNGGRLGLASPSVRHSCADFLTPSNR